ncbi:MAG: bifunctional diaminohydroxyphosphoribosylaminopyrimidine deaminase/5-amino-6-(5-phosphoribosylamino)uracil reductase RibD [Candidatus Velthaea sp.]
MERRRGQAIELERAYLARAYELAARAIADASPNPPVGAVVVRDGRTLGEGYHHRCGEPHAEVEALLAARAGGADVRGATLYVSLEPCDHHGRTGPCTQAILAAGIARVVAGTLDPNAVAGGGAARLRAAGVAVDVVDDSAARALIERFAFATAHAIPFVTLKMAMSLDGAIAPRPCGNYAVSGAPARELVRDLRYEYDAVMVGAGTIRADDAQLTVRPHRTRRKPYVRVVVCENDAVPAHSRVFAAPPDAPAGAYAPTIVLAPAGIRERFTALETIADVVYVGPSAARTLDLAAALRALRERDLCSVLCEGGPTLGGRLLEAHLVARIVWFIAPRFLQTPQAVPVLAGADLTRAFDGWRFDRVERVGNDMLVSARVDRV